MKITHKPYELGQNRIGCIVHASQLRPGERGRRRSGRDNFIWMRVSDILVQEAWCPLGTNDIGQVYPSFSNKSYTSDYMVKIEYVNQPPFEVNK